MKSVTLDGCMHWHNSSGSRGYYEVEVTPDAARDLSSQLKTLTELSSSLEVRLTGGSIQFFRLANSRKACRAKRGNDDVISVSASHYFIDVIAHLLDRLAQEEPEPRYLEHFHLDAYLTDPGSGLSDIVFQLRR